MRELDIGSKWKHFKGHIYEIVGIAKDSETLEELVIYKDDNNTWARKKDEFLSEVDHDKYKDVEQKYRFEKLEG